MESDTGGGRTGLNGMRIFTGEGEAVTERLRRTRKCRVDFVNLPESDLLHIGALKKKPSFDNQQFVLLWLYEYVLHILLRLMHLSELLANAASPVNIHTNDETSGALIITASRACVHSAYDSGSDRI